MLWTKGGVAQDPSRLQGLLVSILLQQSLSEEVFIVFSPNGAIHSDSRCVDTGSWDIGMFALVGEHDVPAV